MRICFFFAIAGLASSGFAQTVIFDNTTSYLHHGMQMLSAYKLNGAEVGDEVHLSGKARDVVELKIRMWYTGTNTASFDARIRFRNMSTTKHCPGPPVLKNGKIVAYAETAEPAEAFYEGEVVKDLQVAPGMNEYTFVIPHVKVPDRFVWTIQAYNGKGFVGELGPAYYNPPTTGSSEDFFWHSDMGSPWIAYTWGADPFANFGARILAAETQAKGNPIIPPLP